MGERRRRTMGVPPHQRSIKWGPLSEDVKIPDEAREWDRQALANALAPCDGCDSIGCAECSRRRTAARRSGLGVTPPYSYGRYRPEEMNTDVPDNGARNALSKALRRLFRRAGGSG